MIQITFIADCLSCYIFVTWWRLENVILGRELQVGYFDCLILTSIQMCSAAPVPAAVSAKDAHSCVETNSSYVTIYRSCITGE